MFASRVKFIFCGGDSLKARATIIRSKYIKWRFYNYNKYEFGSWIKG